ncbi:MAG TPA: TIGR01212 family radical SAM protein, partial [Syntrophales bacterium]|nr:TIGR01212 family radical SAM protein [Syntrophales bacterium]
MTQPGFSKSKKRYRDFKSFLVERFGCRVYKLQIDAGFTCPNRDGTLAAGGCAYCDGRGSALRLKGPLPPVEEQIRAGKALYRNLRGAAKFIAYFQTFTNTYAPVERLRAIYDEALAQPDVVGLSVGTRPDCVDDDTLRLLEGCAKRSHVWVEYGLQSIHDRTLKRINRGHDAAAFVEAVRRTAGRGLFICAHVILGLPGETRADMLETARAVAALPIDGIKVHSLLALRGTEVGRLFEEGKIELMTQEDYVSAVCDVLELLPPSVVVQRITAEGYRDIYLGPDWAQNKLKVLNAID